MRQRGVGAAGLAAALLAAAPGRTCPQLPGHPPEPWSAFAGLKLGIPLDDVLALGAQCWPVLTARPPSLAYTPALVAQFAFGFALPHSHRDTTAVRAALEQATMCEVGMLRGHARALVLGIDRTVVAVTVWFNVQPGTDSLATDSLRGSLRRAWRGGALAPTLDSWYGTTYRAFYLVPRPVPGAPAEFARPRLILVDIAACSAFERRVHRRPGSGRAESC